MSFFIGVENNVFDDSLHVRCFYISWFLISLHFSLESLTKCKRFLLIANLALRLLPAYFNIEEKSEGMKMTRNNTKSNLTVTIFAMVFAALLIGPHRALADLFTFDLGSINISGLTGPYVEVTVNRTSNTTATITFASLTNGGNLYLMGDGGAADLNVNGTYTLGTVSVSNSIAGFSPVFDNNTPGNVDGWGTFNLSLNLVDGFTGTADSISFGLTNTSGTWTSARDVLASSGQIAAAHVFPCVLPCSSTEIVPNTGFAAGDGRLPPAQIPEPWSFVLLGAGLCAIRLVGHRLF
jgi:hypothetical protein